MIEENESTYVEQTEKTTMKMICKRLGCNVTDCPYHHLNHEASPEHYESYVHLEGNPLYCKKGDWNGYRFAVNGEDFAKEEGDE